MWCKAKAEGMIVTPLPYHRDRYLARRSPGYQALEVQAARQYYCASTRHIIDTELLRDPLGCTAAAVASFGQPNSEVSRPAPRLFPIG
jgi:hypothetical protein